MSTPPGMIALPALMPEPRFWQLMTRVDHPLLLSGQDAASLLPLQAALGELPPGEIVAFALRLADRLEKLLIASRARQAPFGEDALLYAACHAVARGQAWFEASRRCPGMFDDPDADPQIAWCEPLLYVARQAWGQAAGREQDDFPVWTLEDGLKPFVSGMPAMEAVAEVHACAAAWAGTFTVRAHFEQHPGIARTVEPDEQRIRVTLADFLDDYFWRLLDLGDYLGLIDEAGQNFQMLHDAGKNLYWAEIPCEAERVSRGQEFSREVLLTLLHRLPARFSPAMFDSPQTLAWDE